MRRERSGVLMLTVACAAIRLDDGTIFSVERPGRHCDVIREIRAAGRADPVGGDRQGFLLSDGRFGRWRKAALAVALRAGQVEREGCTAPQHGLFSEDLW